MNKIAFTFILLAYLLFTANISSAYQEDTHETLNTAIAEFSGIETYLTKILNFSDGINTEIEGLKIYRWIADGGKEEDSPFWRCQNHFHDPLAESWDQAGLLHTNSSSILWAQDPENEWSWPSARRYYYAALTGDSSEISGTQGMNETERGLYFARTFRSLGQVMHLTEDKTVPSHVRNDSHIIESVLQLTNYEKTVKRFGDRKDDIYSPELFEDAYDNPITYAPSILSQEPNPLAPIPIARIIDTDTYSRESGPDVTIGNAIGLAEYTNANFFSEDTVNSSAYPYPDIENCSEIVLVDIISVDGNIYPRKYFRKTAEENCGETNNCEGYLLSAVDKLYFWRKLPIVNWFLQVIPLLDTNVYRDYASLLLPRAVGYSASLLDYFFRGDIDMARTLSGGYIIINHSDEPMNGTFALYYDDASGNRYMAKDAMWTLTIPAGGKSQPVYFNPPNDANEPDKYMLIFRGQMGQETDAVAGKIINLAAWEPWGETICENNQWLISLYRHNYYGKKLCEDPLGAFVINQQENNHILSTYLSPDPIYGENYQRFNTIVAGEEITNAKFIKFKISTYADAEASGSVVMWINNTDLYLLTTYVCPEGEYEDIFCFDDNNGEEQIINLQSIVPDGKIDFLGFELRAWNTGTISYTLDYIDFLVAE